MMVWLVAMGADTPLWVLATLGLVLAVERVLAVRESWRGRD